MSEEIHDFGHQLPPTPSVTVSFSMKNEKISSARVFMDYGVTSSSQDCELMLQRLAYPRKQELVDSGLNTTCHQVTRNKLVAS